MTNLKTSSQFIICTCVALIASACSNKYASVQPEIISTDDMVYGSEDTTNNSIEIAGRLYNIQPKPSNPVAAVVVPSTQPMQYAYALPYQPLGYYSDGIINRNVLTNNSTTSSGPVSAETSTYDPFVWY